MPTLAALRDSFPFVILGFHSDNGSEYVNHRVAALLRKLLVEFTKSRARQTNDNALVESKNGSALRKHLGYQHIPARYAQHVNAFSTEVLTPYLNYHRPCWLLEETIDSKGRRRKHYSQHHLMMNRPGFYGDHFV